MRQNIVGVIPADLYPDFPERARATQEREGKIVSTYTKEPCDECGKMCWLGDRSKAFMEAVPDTKKMCPFCMALLYGKKSMSQMIHNAQRLDIAQS